MIWSWGIDAWEKVSPDFQFETLKLIKYYNNTIKFNHEIYLVHNITSFVPLEIDPTNLKIAEFSIKLYSFLRFFVLLSCLVGLKISFESQQQIYFLISLIVFLIAAFSSFRLYALRISMNSGISKVFIVGAKIETAQLVYKLQGLIEESRWQRYTENREVEHKKPEIIYQAGEFGIGVLKLVVNNIIQLVGGSLEAFNVLGAKSPERFWIFFYLNIQESAAIFLILVISRLVNYFIVDISFLDLIFCLQNKTNKVVDLCLYLAIFSVVPLILFFSQVFAIFLFILTPSLVDRKPPQTKLTPKAIGLKSEARTWLILLIFKIIILSIYLNSILLSENFSLTFLLQSLLPAILIATEIKRREFVKVYAKFKNKGAINMTKNQDENYNAGSGGDSYNQSGNFGIGHMSGGNIGPGANVVGVINNMEKKSLAEAAAEIQQLLDQLSQTYSPREAEQKVAESLANKAKQDPSFKQSLKTWSQSLLGKGSETAVVETVKEGVKRVIPLAISLLI